jgi:hypothetical protein
LKDTKGVIRSRKSKKNRQNNGQKKKDRRTNNDLQNTTQKTTDQVIWSPLKTGVELRCFGRISSYNSTSGTCRVNLVTNPVIGYKWGRTVITTYVKLVSIIPNYVQSSLILSPPEKKQDSMSQKLSGKT